MPGVLEARNHQPSKESFKMFSIGACSTLSMPLIKDVCISRGTKLKKMMLYIREIKDHCAESNHQTMTFLSLKLHFSSKVSTVSSFFPPIYFHKIIPFP